MISMCLLKADAISYLYRVVTYCLRIFYDFFHTFEMITFAFKCFFYVCQGDHIQKHDRLFFYKLLPYNAKLQAKYITSVCSNWAHSSMYKRL